MKKRSLLPLLLPALATLGASAQNLPGKCEAYMPRVLNSTTISMADVDNLASSNYGQNGSTSKYWDVYSDRCDNALYSSAGGSKNGKTLKFNQKVRIAQIKDNYALVYTENRPGGVNYPKISDSATVEGWIPMDHLLLWNQCPTNQLGVHHKALLFCDANKLSRRSNMAHSISWSPDPDNSTHTDHIATSLGLHYIMKSEQTVEGKRYLLASDARLTGSTNEMVLEGWVNKNDFVVWGNRACLEPNWDNDDVAYFVSKNEKACLYDDVKLTNIAQSCTYGNKNNEGQEATQYRMPPQAMRFPILGGDTDQPKDVFKTLVFGIPQGGLDSQKANSQGANKCKEAHLQDISHINLIVVMDATKSMKPYFPSVAKAVKEATQIFGDNVSIGVVLYRDYADGNNMIEVHKMAHPTDASLQNFFANIGRNGYGANSVSKTHHGAMYLGIKTALDYEQLGYEKNQTNAVFIFGDCGNDPYDTQVTADEIHRMAEKVNAQFFSFQVSNQDKEAWSDFRAQVASIQSEQAKYLYKNIDPEIKIAWQQIDHGLTIKPKNIEVAYYASECHTVQPGEMLAESMLTSFVKSSCNSLHDANEAQKLAIKNGGEYYGTGGNNKSYNDFLRGHLGEDYDKIITPSNLLSYTGYVRANDGNGHDYWQTVLLFSSEELIELIKRLEPLKVAVKTKNVNATTRSDFAKAIRGIIQSMTEMSPTEVDQLPTDYLTRLLTGLDVDSPMLCGKANTKAWTLAEIRNPKACPDEEFKKLLASVALKIDNLSQLPKSASFKYSFTQNNHTYYWVPLSMLP